VSRYQRAVEVEDLIVTLAQSRQGLTIEEISERYDVSRRTAERMRDAVAERFPLVEAARHEGDRRKRWRIDSHTLQALLPLGARERAIVARAADALREAGRARLAAELESLVFSEGSSKVDARGG
jgi:predicted DNA-binding transcriptional regulator YafY